MILMASNRLRLVVDTDLSTRKKQCSGWCAQVKARSKDEILSPLSDEPAPLTVIVCFVHIVSVDQILMKRSLDLVRSHNGCIIEILRVAKGLISVCVGALVVFVCVCVSHSTGFGSLTVWINKAYFGQLSQVQL